MEPKFLQFDDHLINTGQIASASNTETGLHINMIGGGFFEIPGMSVEGLGALLAGAAF